ncbi:MAG: hypothetical protein EOP60_00330 [Sphingomonadales bacterium]|nr:MAG: hypothetical protein EOP60_00330 [Sphingomonadales bacterium]
MQFLRGEGGLMAALGKTRATLLAAAALVAASLSGGVQAEDRLPGIDDATVLSEFGGRPAFSPDGKRLAFVGKTYGDAFEMDLATRRVRNLTANIPHHGVTRIQYLPNGDFLVTAPRTSPGTNARAHLEMWVLDRSLTKGLQPLGAQVFEGIDVSRKRNLVAWTVIAPELKPGDPWQMGFARPTRRYTAEIAYRAGVPVLANQHEIMAALPDECVFIEPQDFRDDDRELVYSCMGKMAGGRPSISVMGTRLAGGADTIYFRREGEYAEVEGIAPGGAWSTVECGVQDKAALPPLDICRLELKAGGGGALTRIVRGAEPGRAQDISNPVISPDGKWVAFQRSVRDDPDIGGGNGVFLLRLP